MANVALSGEEMKSGRDDSSRRGVLGTVCGVSLRS